MLMKNEEKWMANYEALKAYIDEHHHLPDKHKETDRNKLNWWKYQMKKKKAGTLTEEQEQMLQTLADSRSNEHTGGRKKMLMNNIKLDKNKIKRILTFLKDSAYIKKTVFAEAIDTCNFYELEYLYSKIPGLYKGLFSSSYLIRKDVSSIFKSNFHPGGNIVDYIGKMVYVVKRNASTINQYVGLKSEIEKNFILGDYEKAKDLIIKVNKEISYSYWAVSYLLKIERLKYGQQAAIDLHNKFYKTNENFWFRRFCTAAYYTCSFDYVTDLHKRLYTTSDAEYANTYNSIIQAHFLAYEGIEEGDWAYWDMNSSIIDLYNNLINVIPTLKAEDYANDDIKSYIRELNDVISDPFIEKFAILLGIHKNYKSPESRIAILNAYLQGEYDAVVSLSHKYLDIHPLDMEVLLVCLKSEVFSGKEENKYDKEGSLYDRIRYHLFALFLHNDDTTFHYRKLKGFCQSLYECFEIRYLYTYLVALESKDLWAMCNNAWKYSNYRNISDASFYDSYRDRIDYIDSLGLSLNTENLFKENIGNLSIDCWELSIAERKGDGITNKLIENVNTGLLPGFIKDSVVSHIFAYYIEQKDVEKAISFLVEQKVKDYALDISVSESQSQIVFNNHDALKKTIALELTIFYYLINADSETVYLSYKNYLRSIGVTKASEILVDGNEKISFFLSFIATQKILTRHVLRFKKVEDVMNERISICQKLNDYYDNKVYADEISGIIRDLRILELNKKVDDSKIYVDIQSIKDNDLDEAKALFKMYDQSSRNINLFEENINQLIAQLSSISLNADVYVNVGGYSNSSEKLSYHKDLLKKMFIQVRDQFLLNPKSGLDNYLSTRIRHGTLINQLRNHFETNCLITNKKGGEYSLNEYWITKKLKLTNTPALECAKRFSEFSSKIDSIIFEVKDKYVQVATENVKEKENACFNYDIAYFLHDIDELQVRTELNSYDAILSEVFNILWQHTDDCLEDMKHKMSYVQNDMLNELHSLEKDITGIVGRYNAAWPSFHDAITQCCNDIQNDIDVVNRWFNRSDSVDFNFTIRQVIDTCMGFINNNNKIHLDTKIDCNSQSELKGKYFSTLYDMFHDILNNVLYYEKEKSIGGSCKIDIMEINDYLNIRVSNPIDPNQEEELTKKAIDINDNLDILFRGGRSRTEGNSGCIKIFNAVHNHLGTRSNEYINSVENGEFIVKIDLELKPLRI